MPSIPEKLDVIAQAHGVTSDDAIAELVGVRGRQSIYNWRTGGNVAKINLDRIDREYRKALEMQREARRSDDDYRRRAIAALNLLEGDELVRFARELVTAAAAQEFIPPGEAVAAAADSAVLARQRSRGSSQKSGA